MAIFKHNLIMALTCVVILLQNINCKPVKRSATDCYGTDCTNPQDEELDFNGNHRADTKLLENITTSVIRAFPEITDLLRNIAHIHQNTTVPTLPSIAQSLEDDKNLQTYQNHLIENGTAVMTQIVKLMESQKEMQERHNQQMHEKVDRQYQMQVNQQAMQERHYQWMQDQAERHNIHPERVTISFPQTSLPQTTMMSQIQPYRCINGLSSGEHIISPNNTALLVDFIPVICDMDTDGGGWIVIQRRFDGSVNFDRVWDDYETGFGNPDGEFWLGLDKLHVITSRGEWEFRVDLQDFGLNKAYAIYDNFRIGSNSSFYRLDIGYYSGTAGDGMRLHDLNGMAFTTKDQDHDQYRDNNCAINLQGAWWHKACTYTNLNGLYLGQNGTIHKGMTWYSWQKNHHSMKKSELKIRLIEG